MIKISNLILVSLVYTSYILSFSQVRASRSVLPFKYFSLRILYLDMSKKILPYNISKKDGAEF